MNRKYEVPLHNPITVTVEYDDDDQTHQEWLKNFTRLLADLRCTPSNRLSLAEIRARVRNLE